MVAHFRLLTLGTPLLLTTAGDVVRFRTRKHFALLIRLALEPGRRFARDYLIDLLWREAVLGRGRHSLSQAITVLRRTVGRSFLATHRATVALEPGAVALDVHEIDCGQAEIRGRFLEGFEIRGARSFTEWRDGMAATLHPQLRDCLVRRMAASKRQGDFDSVERHARLLQDLDPLSEDAVRGIMEARLWAGDRANALQTYEGHARRLAADLRAKPGPELTRLAELLREGRTVGGRLREDTARPSVEERRFEAESILGRQREFAEIYAIWRKVRERHPRLVLVFGDHGIGKTTLTNAFASSCQVEGAIIARAQAFEAEKNLPYAVLAELVRQLTLQRAIGAADPAALAELTRLVPEILSVFPGVPGPSESTPEVVPLRLAEAFLKAVAAAAEETPAVLLVDDAHLADAASMAILHILARKLEGLRLLLLFTARRWETPSGVLALGTDADPATPWVHTMDLEPLSESASTALLQRVCPPGEGRWGDPPVSHLLQAGRGNPLALELLARDWVLHGAESLVMRIADGSGPQKYQMAVPQTIRMMLDREARQLDVATRAALDLAAILGRRIGDLWLYRVIGCSEGEALARLTQLLDAHLLRDVAGQLEFRNEMVRVHTYYNVPSTLRFELHRRLGRALEEYRTPEGERPDSEIAWHYIAGADLARALPFALTGAQHGLGAGAPQEAEQILTAIRGVIDDPGTRRRMLLLLTAAQLSQSKAETALTGLDAVINDAEASRQEIAQATRLYASAMYLINQNSTAKHLEMATKASAVARECGSSELLARALFEYARAGVESGNEEMIRAAREELRRTGIRIEEDRIPPFAHHADAFCSYYLLELDEAVTSAKKAVGECLSSNNVPELAQAFTGLGNCMTAMCRVDEAKEAYERALTLYRRAGDKSRISVLCSNLSAACLIGGEVERAIASGEESLKAGMQVTAQPVLLRTWANLAFAYLLAGQSDKALECHLALQHWIRQGRSWAINIDYCCERASFQLALGNISEALDLMSQAQHQSEGRENLLVNLGTLERLKVFLAYHTKGVDASRCLADVYLRRFENKHALAYLEAVAATAWLEMRSSGAYTESTSRRLVLLDNPTIRGKRAVLAAQGFLEQLR